jgi:ubiquitin carboxyl-terminal hydrolase 36/42
MHVEGDLGFSSLVVLVFCVVIIPLGCFIIRCKWRGAVARKEEIKRLLVLAAEEAARAEFEAAASYGTVPVLTNNYQCAVCFCPTTTRCARCKAVRYWYVNFVLMLDFYRVLVLNCVEFRFGSGEI